METTDRFVVGLDFGTTFTGVAFAYSNFPEDIEIIRIWPGGNGITSEKVPSEFTYDMRPPSTSIAGHQSDSLIELTSSFSRSVEGLENIRWGYQVKPGDQRIRCIKLFLDRNHALPKFADNLGTALYLQKCSREVLDAVADFLAKIRLHTLETLRKRYGEAFINSMKVQFVLTVPAIWSDTAKDATREAASRAGIRNDELIMISEPEAAAVYTIKAIQPNRLRVGDNIIVCDAGGGTVDLISYKIANLSPLGIEEAQVGTGGLCGSAFLNYGFEEHVKTRIGETEFLRLQQTNPAAWETGLKHFEEYVKRNLSVDEPEDFNIPMPGFQDNEDAGVSMGYLFLTYDQAKEIFEPVIKQIIDLVEDQVAAIHSAGGLVSAILLVGGFGQSNYLHARIKANFNRLNFPPTDNETLGPEEDDHDSHNSLIPAERANRNIEVMQPLNAWTAVARGTVIRGLQGSIALTRLTRYHYGIKKWSIYDPTKHSIDRCMWQSDEEMWRVSQMAWFVAKGVPVSEEQAVSIPFCSMFSANMVESGAALLQPMTLVAFGGDSAPLVSQTDFTNVCTVTFDLREVPGCFSTKLVNASGLQYFAVSFEAEMKIESASLIFSLKVGGKSYGTARVSFDH